MEYEIDTELGLQSAPPRRNGEIGTAVDRQERVSPQHDLAESRWTQMGVLIPEEEL